MLLKKSDLIKILVYPSSLTFGEDGFITDENGDIDYDAYENLPNETYIITTSAEELYTVTQNALYTQISFDVFCENLLSAYWLEDIADDINTAVVNALQHCQKINITAVDVDEFDGPSYNGHNLIQVSI